MFKEYPSIDNITGRLVLKYLKNDTEEFVVTEKVHGANIQFIYSVENKTMNYASRNQLLDTEEKMQKFFGAADFLRQLGENKIRSLCETVLGDDSLCGNKKVKFITVYGELFGGVYVHQDVAKLPNVRPIQNCKLQYSPKHEFYGFDVVLRFERDDGNLNSNYLDFDTCQRLFKDQNLLCELAEFRGSLLDCVDASANIKLQQSTIPGRLGLPERIPNIREGNIIRPVVPRFESNGNRIMIKDKNDEKNFGTEESKCARDVQFVRYKLTEEEKALAEKLAVRITEDRLGSVRSKNPEIFFVDPALSESDKKKHAAINRGKQVSKIVDDLLDEVKRERQDNEDYAVVAVWLDTLDQAKNKRLNKILVEVAEDLVRNSKNSE